MTRDDALDFAGRALIGLTFAYWGGRQLVDAVGLGAPDGGGWTSYMAAAGVPGALLPLVILTQLGGGIVLAIGWRTRIAAFLLAGFCLLADLFFHLHWEAPAPAGHFNWIVFIKNLAVAGGLLAIAGRGPVRISLDARRARRRGLAAA